MVISPCVAAVSVRAPSAAEALGAQVRKGPAPDHGMGGRRKGACPVGIVQDLAAAFEVAWDLSGDGPLGSILPSAGLPADRRKASGDTLNLWFSEPLSLTVGRMLRLSPVLSFRPTEIDAAAAATVNRQWDKLDETLRQALGPD